MDTFDADVREKLLEGIRRTANAVAAMSGAPPPDIKLSKTSNAVVNDAAVTARTEKVFKAAFGAMAVLQPQPNPTSDDYSEFIIAGVPSLFFSLGGYDPAAIAAAAAKGQSVPTNHSPYFAPTPEPTIRTGVEAMTLAVLNVMAP